ncbi:MAG: hypothetical protein ABSD85_16675 [Acidimicrobiales bacterium]
MPEPEPVRLALRAYLLPSESLRPVREDKVTSTPSPGRRTSWANRPSVMSFISVVAGDQEPVFTLWQRRSFWRKTRQGVVFDPARLTADRIRALGEWAGSRLAPLAYGRPQVKVEPYENWREPGGDLYRFLHLRNKAEQTEFYADDGLSNPERAGAPWLALWDLAWEVSRLAVGPFGTGRLTSYGSWSLKFDAEGKGPHMTLRTVGDGEAVLPRLSSRPVPIDILALARVLDASDENPWSMAHDLGSQLSGEPVEGPVVVGEGDDIAEVADRLHVRLDATFDALHLALREIDRLGDGGLRIDPRHAVSRGGAGTASMRSVGVPPLYAFANRELASEPLALHASAAGAFGGRGEGSLLRVAHLGVLGDIQSAFGISASAQGLSDLLLARSWEVTRPLDEVRDLLSRDPDDLWQRFALDREAWRGLRATFVLVRPQSAFLPARIDMGDVHDAAHGRFIVEVAPLDSETPLWFPLADCVAARLRSPAGSLHLLDAIRVAPIGRRVLKRVRGSGWTWFDPQHDDFFAWAMLDRQAANDEADTREPGSPEESVWRARARFARNVTNTVSFGQPLRVDRDILPKGTSAAIPFLDGEEVVEAAMPHKERAGPDFCPVVSSSTTAGCRLLVSLLQHEWERRGGTVSAIHTDSLLVVSSPEGGEVTLPDGSSICSLSWSDARETFACLDALLPPGVRGPLAKAKYGTLDEPTEAVVIACNRYRLWRGDEIVHASEHGLGNLAPPDDGRRVPGAGHRVWIDKGLKALGDDAVDELEFANAPSVSRFRITSPEQASWFGQGVRPFNLALAAHPDVLGQLTQSAGPVALEDLTKGPENRLSLDWRRRGGRPTKLGVRSPGDDYELGTTVFAQSIGWYLRRWWATPERGSEPVAGTPNGPVRGLVVRKPLTVVALSYVGSEGSSIDRRRRLASVEGDDPVLLSEGLRDDRWPILLDAIRELRRLKPAVVARVVPPRTLRYLLDDRQPSEQHRHKLAVLLAAEARRYLRVAGVPLPESQIGILVAFTKAVRAERYCLDCGQLLPADVRPNRRLCDGCRRFGARRDDSEDGPCSAKGAP